MQNVENGVIWGGQGALEVTGNATTRQSAYDFLFDFNRYYVSIFSGLQCFDAVGWAAGRASGL